MASIKIKESEFNCWRCGNNLKFEDDVKEIECSSCSKKYTVTKSRKEGYTIHSRGDYKDIMSDSRKILKTLHRNEKISIILVIIPLFIACTFFYFDQESSKKQHFEQMEVLDSINRSITKDNEELIKKFLKERDITFEQLEILIENKQEYFDLHLSKGMLNILKGGYDEAIKEFGNVIRLDNDSAIAYNNRGFAYSKNGDYDDALKDYTQAIKLNPNYKEAYHNRGNIYADKGEYENAIKDYNKAIELDPNYSFAYNDRGLVYLYNKSYDNAISDFTEAIRSDETLAPAYYHRGIAYFDKEKYNNHTIDNLNISVSDFNKAIELNFNASDINTRLSLAYYHMGCEYLENHDLSNAIQNLNKSIELAPHFASYNNRGIAHLYSRNFDKALQDFNSAISIGSDDPYVDWAWEGKGATLEQLNRTDEAIECYEKALEINPDNVEVQEKLERLLNS